MLHSVGLYLPSENTFIDYIDIISDIDENVNNQITENSSNAYDKLAVDDMNDRLSNEVLSHLQMFVDSDIQIYGEIQESTLNAIDMQGYKYIDGKLEKANSIHENDISTNDYTNTSEEFLMKASLTNYLKYNNQLPADVLSSKADIELYSFKSQINDTQKVENLLWKIQESDMQVVSMDGNNTDGFRLYKLNNEYQVQPYNYNTYPSESDAMHEVFSNNKIAKLIPYDSMKMAEFSKDLSPITESENLKYPYIQIVWSDNMKLNHTDILSIPEAKDKFNEVNNQVNDEPIKTSFSLYLDSNNIYNFNYLHSKDGISIPEHIKIHLQELQSQETLDESLENLNDYIAHELPDAEQLSFEESMESDFEI